MASAELIDELDALALGDSKMLYELLRQNYFMGRHIKHSGWGNDWLPRLYNRQAHSYNEAMVHENIIPLPDARMQRLQSPIRHMAVERIGQFLVKMDRYTELRMEEGSKGYGPFHVAAKSQVGL